MKKWSLTVAIGMALVSSIAVAQELPQSAPSVQEAQEKSGLPGEQYWPNTGTSGAVPLEAPPRSVEEVKAANLANLKNPEAEIPWVRAQAIQEAAASFGAQAGMAARAKDINRELRIQEAMYNRVYDFNALMLEPGFLPPVIVEGRDAYKQPSDFEVRAADRIYKIEFPARLVNVAPRWQDYLFVEESVPMGPDRSVLPKNKAEEALWDQWATQGWQQGVALAEETFRSNLGRLNRDFRGMLRFKTLYEQGLVTKPLLASANLGVTGGGDEMAINDRIYEITDKAQLNPDQKDWSAPMPRTDIRDPKPERRP